ncbi:hypothetical protein NPIL_150451 [Nephila pilipes]|uniref:Uncharacterized protein n=1 Tax=Nephila pilipes TaxID=299642 RepID=A0A8X6MZB3_NEPPI|nr:hypothetical protein NPIL_150451 [Nephila pilipes]
METGREDEKLLGKESASVSSKLASRERRVGGGLVAGAEEREYDVSSWTFFPQRNKLVGRRLCFWLECAVLLSALL